MKVFTLREELLGKKAYKDKRLEGLREKFHPAKVTFISVEFSQDKESCDCLLVSKEELLDLIIEDMDKCERLMSRKEEGKEKEILEKVNSILNREKPLSCELSREEIEEIAGYSFITTKPVIFFREAEIHSLLEDIFKKVGVIFFFTVNKNEAKAWQVKENTSILDCAAKIHTDLARGFIRGEVFNIKDLGNFRNLEEARQKKILKVVDKDYVVCDGDVINIRFKV